MLGAIWDPFELDGAILRGGDICPCYGCLSADYTWRFEEILEGLFEVQIGEVRETIA